MKTTRRVALLNQAQREQRARALAQRSPKSFGGCLMKLSKRVADLERTAFERDPDDLVNLLADQELLILRDYLTCILEGQPIGPELQAKADALAARNRAAVGEVSFTDDERARRIQAILSGGNRPGGATRPGH